MPWTCNHRYEPSDVELAPPAGTTAWMEASAEALLALGGSDASRRVRVAARQAVAVLLEQAAAGECE
jgi:hypothetical protein